MGTNERKELREIIRSVRSKMKVTKVVCTRSVKGKYGDNYVGFSAAWDTIQDDAGGAADMISSQDDQEIKESAAAQGMTLKEARFAGLILAMQTDIAAHDHAMASSNITPKQREGAIQAIKANYGKLMVDMLGNGEKNGG